MPRKLSLILIVTALIGVCFFLVKNLKDPESSLSGEKEKSQSVSEGFGGGYQSSEVDKARPSRRENRAKGVMKSITTASGLSYQVLRKGDGVRPGPTDKVKVAYRGRIRNGGEFDRSPEGKPMEFPLNAVIKGWQEGVQLMRVGAKYRFVIPPELAYGKRGAGELIPPDATLIFDVELIDVEK